MTEIDAANSELSSEDRTRFLDALEEHIPKLRADIIRAADVIRVAKEYFPNADTEELERTYKDKVISTSYVSHELKGTSVGIGYTKDGDNRAGNLMTIRIIREAGQSFVFWRYFSIDANGSWLSQKIGRTLINHETEDLSEEDIRLIAGEPSHELDAALAEFRGGANARWPMIPADLEKAVELLNQLGPHTKSSIQIYE